MDLRILVVIALLGASGTLAIPTDLNRCAGECAQVYNPKFDYSPGKTYTYTYEASTTVKLPGVATDEPHLGISAAVDISVITPCEFALKLNNVQLSGSQDGTAEFKKIVEEKILLFSFSDGRINHVCPDPKDPTWAVNIKRAVLSTLQNTMDKDLESRVREVDIAGQCDTHYEVTSTTGKGSTINKHKDLATCTKRVSRITSLQGIKYASYSRVQSPPLAKATQNCNQVIANNIIQSVECEEVHILRVFARGPYGATTVAKTSLTFNKQSKGLLKSLPRKLSESSLLFDHSEEQSKATNDVSEASALLKEICDKTGDELQPEAANDFTRLTYLIRRLSADSIRGLLLQLDQGSCKTPKTKDTFLGAVKQAGTQGAVEVLVELLNNNRISGLRARIWLTSLAFIQRPTSGTIEAVIPLVDSPKPDRLALLSVSALVHTFCRHNENCHKDKAVQRLIEKLGRHLAFKCKANGPEEEDKVIAALKAFGNIGLAEKYLSVIQDCVKDSSLSIPIRLAAIQAFRRATYDDNTRRALTNILEDQTQHTELRIASYLGLMRHPSYKTIQKIEWILDHEVINQVNSFIWTHLKNLQESKSPVNYEARRLARDIRLGKKYVDGRKFSRNYEASFYSDRINAGAELDTNIIFTPDSFLPRSASFNLTLDLFGHSVDLLQVDARATNFEYLLEKYYGPTGIVKTNSKAVLRSKLRDRWIKISQGIENEATSHRQRREAPHKTQKFQQIQSKAAIKRVNKPEGSLSVKVFGNEIRWYDFHSLEDIYDREDPYNLKDIFNKLATHKEVDVARNIMFLDTTSTIPTATGFPLRFDLNGTASIALKLKSHFDVRRFLLRPRSADIQSYVQPSASLEFAGSLIIDGGVTRTGLKLASTLYSSVAIDGTVFLEAGKELSVKLDLPTPEMNIFSIKSNLFVVDRDTEKPIDLASKSRYELKGCSRNLGSMIGAEFCTVLSLPRPFINRERPLIPLGGPVEYSLKFRKVDPNLQGYHFRYLNTKETDPSTGSTDSKFTWSLNAPGSAKDREYSVSYELNQSTRNIRFDLKTPATKIGLTGDIAITEASWDTNLLLKVNDDFEYSFRGKTGVTLQGEKTTLNPTWEITRSGSPKVILTGSITSEPKKFEFDLRDAPNSEKKPYLIKGHVYRANEDNGAFNWDAELKFVTPSVDSEFEAALVGKDDDREMKREFKLSFEHGPPGGEKKYISIKTERETKWEDNGYDIRRSIEWKWSRYPNYNVRANLHLEREGGEYENTVDIRWTDDFKNDLKRFLLEHKAETKKNEEGVVDRAGSLKVIYPRRDINWDIRTQLNVTPRRLIKATLKVKYGNGKAATVSVDFKNQSTRLLKYSLDVIVDCPEREMRLQDSVEEKKPGEYVGMTLLQWERDKSITLTGFYKNKDTENAVDREAELIIQLQNQPSPLRKYTFLFHRDSEKFKLVGLAVTPDKTYEVSIQHELIGLNDATLKIVVRLPWIDANIDTKRDENGAKLDFDIKSEKRNVIGFLNVKKGSPGVYTFDLKWDAGRDDSKKLNLRIEVVQPPHRGVDLKAVLTLPSRVIKADINYELPRVMFNGVHNLKVHVEYAPDRKVDVTARIVIDKNQANRRLSSGEVHINSATTKELKIVYDTELETLGPNERRFVAKFDIDRQTGQDLVLHIDHLRGPKKLDTSVELQTDEGKTYGLGIKGDWDVGPDGFIVGAGLGIKIPTEGLLQDFALVIREGIKRNDEGIDLVHVNQIRLGPGRDFGLALELIRRGPNSNGVDYSALFQIDTPFEDYKTYKLKSGFSWQHGSQIIGKLNTEVILGVRYLKSEIRTDMSRTEKKASFSLTLDSSRVPGTTEFTISFDFENPSFLSTVVAIKHSLGNQVRAELDVDLSAQNTRLYNILITFPGKEIPSIRGHLKDHHVADSRDIEGDIEWAPGKSLRAVGDISSNYNGKLTINSDALDLKDMTVEVNGNMDDKKRSFVVKVNLGPDREIEWHVAVEQKPVVPELHQSLYLTESTVKVNGEDFIKVKLDHNRVRSGHPVHPFTNAYELEIHNPMISFAASLITISPKGVNPTVKICTLDAIKCLELEAYLGPSVQDITLGKISKEFYVKFMAQRAPGDSRTVGLSYTSNQLRANRERSARILWNEEEQKFIGYDFKEELTGDANKPGYIRKHQILLPSRTIEIRADKSSSDQGYVYNLNVLFDAIRQPNRALTVNVDAKRTVVGESITRISRIVIKHPDIKNNLVITNEIRVRQERIIFSQKTEFDLTGRKLTIDLELIDVNKSPSGFNVTYLIGIRQAAAKNLDFKIRGHRARTDEGRTLGFELFWLNKDGIPKAYTIFSETDKVNHVINGVIRTPIRVFDWKGTYEKLEPNGLHSVRADLDFNYNNKLVRRAHIEYSSRPTINLKYYANPADINRMFRLHGGLVDDRNLELSAVHSRDGQTIEDAAFELQLNTSKLLFTRFKWRPGVLQDVQAGIDARSEVLSKGFEEAVHNFADLAKAEVADKTENIRHVVNNVIAPALKAARQKLSVIREELKRDLAPGKLDRLRAVLEELFSSFVDIDAVMESIEGIRNRIREAIAARLDRIGQILDGLGGSLNINIDKIVDYIASLPARIRARRLNFRAKLTEFFERVTILAQRTRQLISNILEDQYVTKALAAFRETWDATASRFLRWLFVVRTGVIDTSDQAYSLYDVIKAKLYEYSEKEGVLPKIVKGILTAIRTVKQKIREIIDNIKNIYYYYREEVLICWRDLYSDFNTNPDYHSLLKEISDYRKELRAKYFEPDDDDIKSLKANIRERTDDLLGRIRNRLEYLIGKDGTYDPKNGLIEYYIPLIQPIDSLRDLRYGMSWTSRKYDHDRPNFRQALQNLKPYLKEEVLRQYLPPFEGEALLIGNQHYKTFDDRFFDFAGQCSYILAQDFVDNNFTVIVNYGPVVGGQVMKESLAVISDRHYIVIRSDSLVTIDGNVAVLPVQIENTEVRQLEDGIRVDNNKGFTAIYDRKHDFISVNVNGFYFGKLGGLFGNYDYEPSNDFRQPDGQNLTREDLFANSWEVAQKCPLNLNVASHDKAEHGSEAYHLCRKVFESYWSPLEACFKHVAPDHFLQVCLEETAPQLLRDETVGDKLCKVVGAYIHTCEHHNIRVNPPSQCSD